jgi:hypothetical protein
MRTTRIYVLLTLITLISIGCATTIRQVDLSPEDLQYLQNVTTFVTRFTVSKDDSGDAWGRAQSFIAQASDMKMQVVTDYVIETFYPNRDAVGPIPHYGYKVVKTPMGNDYIITVECSYSNSFTGDIATQNARILAYYIKTGQLNSKYINNKKINIQDYRTIGSSPDNQGNTMVSGVTPAINKALMVAAGEGNIKEVNGLLDKGANPNIAGEQSGATPLMSATLRGYSAVVKVLLDKGANPNIAMKQTGLTPLMSATNNNRIEIAKALLDKGADVNIKAKERDLTALMFAAGKGNIDIVKLLLQKNADINSKSTDGLTALGYAKKLNHQNIVELLRKVGAKE